MAIVSKLTCQQSWQNIEDRTWLSAGSVVRLWCGSQSTVCVITGETVSYSSLNNNTQITGSHTRVDLLRVDEMILSPRVVILRAADHPKLQTLAWTDSGSAVGLLDWWKRHPEEESSAAIGHFWSHQSRWSASTSTPRTLWGGFNF